jgi:hypothetical protein
MVDAFRKQLDELMGVNRNGTLSHSTEPTSYTDNRLCRDFLAGFCIADKFFSTRIDQT